MPRGYLKRKAETVGKKAARGGSSKRDPVGRCKCDWGHSPRYQKRYLTRKWGRNLGGIQEDDVVDCWGDDWERDYDYESCSDDERTKTTVTSKLRENELQSGAGTNANESFVAVSETNSCGYSLCEDDRSAQNGARVDADISFVAVSETNSCDFSLCEDEESEFSVVEGVVAAINQAGCQKREAARENKSYGPETVGVVDMDSQSHKTIPPLAPIPPPDISYPSESETVQSTTCAICLQEQSKIVRVMKKCRHPSACWDCVRTLYIVKAQQDVSNYPLRCFWPGCDRTLRDTQVQKFAQSQREMEEHFSMQAHAKAQRKLLREVKIVQICPSCSCANKVLPYQKINDKDTEYRVRCIQCSGQFLADKVPPREVLAILAAVGEDFANCPSCGAFFIKAGGCDDMKCICSAKFSFRKAQGRTKRLETPPVCTGTRTYY